MWTCCLLLSIDLHNALSLHRHYKLRILVVGCFQWLVLCFCSSWSDDLPCYKSDTWQCKVLQETVSSIPIVGSISFEGFLSFILLLVVIIVMVVIIAVILVVVVIVIVGVVIVVAIIGIVVVIMIIGVVVVVGGDPVGLFYPNRLGICIPLGQGIVSQGVPVGPVFLLGLLVFAIVAACAYIEKILKRFHMKNSKLRSIPMQEKLRLSKSEGALTPAELKRMQNIPYALSVGSIIYAYLRNTKDMFLVYGGDLKRELKVSCYTDAGYLTDADDLKSQTGYVFVLNGGAVDWKSAKQSIFATSSAEAEYIDVYDASKKAV
ncbi:hypothetical protein Tco_0831876 [Tanacetum coccineum]